MKAHYFDIHGFNQSYWTMYFGYGLIAILLGLVEIALLWQIVTLARVQPDRVKPIVGLLIVVNLLHAFVCWEYFFPVPIVMDIVVAICLGLALVASSSQTAAAQLSS
jgi:hypothetical protein